MKEAYYFPHDSNASEDPKILQMCSVYGAQGYGWYWMLIEKMRDQEGYKLDISGKYALNSLAIRMYTDKDTLVSFLNDCVEEFKLFRRDETHLWSESLLRRMLVKEQKSEKARQSVQQRWAKKSAKPQADTNVSKTYYEDSTDESKTDAKKESKEEESKVKESKVPAGGVASVEEDDPFTYYQNNITPILYDTEAGMVGDLIDTYPAEWIRKAVDEAVLYKARTFKYVDSILKRWAKLNVPNPWEVKKADGGNQGARAPTENPGQHAQKGGSAGDADTTFDNRTQYG